MTQKDLLEFAQTVRDACAKAAGDGFEEAGIAGMCREGVIEYAQDNIRSVKLDDIIERFLSAHPHITDPEK